MKVESDADRGRRNYPLGALQSNGKRTDDRCTASQPVLFDFGILDAAHPAIPTDWGNCNDALSASPYTGVTRSMPNLTPTSIKVGVNSPSSVVAKEKNLSS